MYDALAAVAGAKVVYVDTYPDFRIDLDRVAAAHHAADEDDRASTAPPIPPASWPREEEVRGMAELAAAAERGVVERRDLSPFLLRPAVRLAGQLQSADAGGRRLQQDLRHARLAAGLRPRAVGRSSAR